jgi:hypothetical protein
MTGRFRWERALRSDDQTRGTRLLVLLALGTYMDADGTNASVSQATLAAATGQGDRTIRQHLTAAVEDGWLVRTRRGHRRGDGVGMTSSYRASLPARVRQLSEASTGTVQPVEDDLNRQHDASQPADQVVSTGTGLPPTKGFTDNTPQCVADLAFSKLAVPRSVDTPTQRRELDAKVKVLTSLHGEGLVREALAEIPDASWPFAGQLVTALETGLPQQDAGTPPRCDRCQDTGQTNTGYPCGCPATARRRAS